MSENTEKESGSRPSSPSYVPVAYINHMPRSERRGRARKIINRWSRAHRKDREKGLIEAYEKRRDEANQIIDILNSIDEKWKDRFMEHTIGINKSVTNIMADMQRLLKFYNAISMHSSIDSIDVSIESPLYKIVNESDSLPVLLNKVNKELYRLDRLLDETNSKYYKIPFEGESEKFVDRLSRYVCDLNVMKNLLIQLNVWGDIRPLHLLDSITERPREIDGRSYNILLALIKFTDEDENRGLPFVSKADPSLHSFVHEEVGLDCSTGAFDYRVKKAFSQVGDLLPAIDVPEPETNVAWYFRQRATLRQMHRSLRSLLKTGEISVK